MSENKRRLSQFCFATSATALFSSAAAVPAFASHHHTLQHRETLSAVARHYHVSLADIKTLNHLSNPDSVPDGTKLLIPDPPRRLHVAPQMRHFTHLKGDNVSFRLGPDSSYRRVQCLDQGASVLVTALHDGWAQVKLDNQQVGWVRAEFLAQETGHHFTDPLTTAHLEHVAHAHAHHGHSQVALAHVSAHHHSRDEAKKETTRREAARRQARMASVVHQHHRHEAEIAQGRHHHRQLAHSTPHHTTHVASAAPVHKHSHYSIRVAATRGGNDIVQSAYAYRGTPYVYGGSGRGGFDCSGFTSYLYAHRGVSLPHSARGQFQMGHAVGKGDMKAGDLVFFHTVTPGISHVGMYVGNGRFVHASSRRSGGVRVDNINAGYYSQAFRGARRMLNR